jgi:hypothetical protein
VTYLGRYPTIKHGPLSPTPRLIRTVKSRHHRPLNVELSVLVSSISRNQRKTYFKLEMLLGETRANTRL